MHQFENIKKKTRGRLMVILVLLAIFGSNALGGAIIKLSGAGFEPSNFAQFKQEQAAERGETLTADELAYWEKQDRIADKYGKQVEMATGAILLGLGVAMLGGALYTWVKGDIRRSKLGKMVGAYTTHLGEVQLERALTELDTELANPIYDSKQLALTQNWLIGHVGATRKAVAFPLSCITGVYYYYLIRKIHRVNRGTQVSYFYQILINDKFDKSYVLQLKTRAQLDEVYPMVAGACPNADNGNYESDYLGKYCALPKVEREAQIRDVLRANRTAGLEYCEL